MFLGQMSFYGGIMILWVLAIRHVGMHKLPKRTFLLLWGVVLIRLLIPWQLKLPWTPQDFGKQRSWPEAARQVLGTDAFVASPLAPTVVQTVEKTATLDLLPLLWFLGMTVCALYFVIGSYRYQKEWQTSLPVKDEGVQRWLSEHPLRRQLRVRVSDRIKVPLTYGYWHPVILLPKQMDWQNTRQLEYILLHEYVHIRRGDGVMKWLLVAAVCVHWFNPLVWLMFKMANRDLELACDEAVLAAQNEDRRADYAMTLIQWEERKSEGLPSSSHFSDCAAKERIEAIMKMQKKTCGAVIVSAVLTLGLLGGLAAGDHDAGALHQIRHMARVDALSQVQLAESAQSIKTYMKSLLTVEELNKLAFEEASQEIAERVRNLTANDGALKSLVWPCPSTMRISSPDSGQTNARPGLDIIGEEGAIVVASAAGRASVGYDETYGQFVLLEHGGKMATFYSHLAEVQVQEGAQVLAGETIGHVGASGQFVDSSLYFELRIDGEAVNPNPYLLGL